MKHFIDRAILFAFFTLIGSINVAVAQCDRINYTDFETDLGAWFDGGIHAYNTTINPYEGSKSMRLRGNRGGASAIHSQAIDVSQRMNPELDFQYYPESMEAGEQLIVEVSYDAGVTYFVLANYVSGTHFKNGLWYNARVDLRGLQAQLIVLRIRCKASATTDRVYIDNIAIQECLGDNVAEDVGVVDANCEPGTTCDDQNPCTENDILDLACNCVGTVVDSDGDTVCDVFDICPSGNDLIDLNQNGTPDACEERAFDCITISNVDFEQSNGIWIDGGLGAYRYTGRASNGTKSFRLRGNGGSTSSIYTSVLNLSESINPKIQFKYYAQSMEPGEQLIVEVSLDSGLSFIKVSELTSGIDFTNYSWQSFAMSLKSAGLSSSMIVRIRCAASSFSDTVYVDEILIDDCSQGGPIASANCLINTACDDGNACTENDVWTTTCDCLGTITDADNDGVCDIAEVIASACAVGTACDDGDVCTINDVYGENCDCAGIIADADTDGVCDANDVCPDGNDTVDNDNNGIPDACDSQIGGCQTIAYSGFESDLGIWNLGGNNARLYSYRGFNSNSSIRLTDNNGIASSIYSNVLDLSQGTPTIEFQYFTLSMEIGEELLVELSTDGGQSFNVINRFVSGIDFLVPQWNIVSIPLVSYNPSSQSLIRLRCNASSTADKVFVDNLAILDCSASEGRNYIVDSFETNEVDVNIYPNPTTDYVTIETQFENNLSSSYQVELLNVAGQLLHSQKMSAHSKFIKLDMTPFDSQQMYFLRTIKDGEIIHNEKIIKI